MSVPKFQDGQISGFGMIKNQMTLLLYTARNYGRCISLILFRYPNPIECPCNILRSSVRINISFYQKLIFLTVIPIEKAD